MTMTTQVLDFALAAIVAIAKCLTVVLVLLLGRGVWWLVHMFFVAPISDPLKLLPGPEAKRFESHFNLVLNPSLSVKTHSSWTEKFGKTFRFNGFGAHDLRLMSFDPAVYTHVLSSPIYEKPWQTRSMLSKLLGAGINVKEGHEHKLQRKIINPAFSPSSIRALSPVFFTKAMELRDEWAQSTTGGSATIDAASWMTRAAFDVIGLAGFDYDFNALSAESGEKLEDDHDTVYLALRRMFKVIDQSLTFRTLVNLYFPILDQLFPGEDAKLIANCHKIIREKGKTILAVKQAKIAADGKLDSSDINEKDLLSLLIRSNMSSDTNAQFSDSEMLDQITAFLFGGADSPSITTAWCLHMLAEHPDMQSKLRAELLDAFDTTQITSGSPVFVHKGREGTPDSGFAEEYFPSDNSAETFEINIQDIASVDFDKLPLLDAVVRETLRLHPPVHGTIRVATQDDWIPVSQNVPGYPVQGKVHIRKGSYVHVPIEGLNYDQSVWGSDSTEFKPERWLAPSHASLPGLQNMMTFSMGPHSCPGARFTLLEVKAFLSVLVCNFSFASSPDVTIKKHNSILTQPYVEGKRDIPGGRSLPIVVQKL